MSKELRAIYRKNGEIDGRCQVARRWARIDARIDAMSTEELYSEEIKYRDHVLAEWDSLDPVQQAFERLSDSHQYRIAEYSRRTPIEKLDYYYNRDNLLTTWSCDPSIADTEQSISQDLLDYLKRHTARQRSVHK